MVAPTAVATFRDKKGNYWVSVDVICDFIGADPFIERRKIKSLGVFKPHTFVRYRRDSQGGRRRYNIFSLPAEELGRWISTFIDVPAYKDPISGRRLVVKRERIDHIRRSIRRQKKLSRISDIEQAISA